MFLRSHVQARNPPPANLAVEAPLVVSKTDGVSGLGPYACGSCGQQLLQTRAPFCARCKSAWYCNLQCQKAAWKAHKPHCAAPTAIAAKTRASLPATSGSVASASASAAAAAASDANVSHDAAPPTKARKAVSEAKAGLQSAPDEHQQPSSQANAGDASASPVPDPSIQSLPAAVSVPVPCSASTGPKSTNDRNMVLFLVTFRILISRDTAVGLQLQTENTGFPFQTVLVMNMFSSLVPRTRLITYSCLERPRTNHRCSPPSRTIMLFLFRQLVGAHDARSHPHANTHIPSCSHAHTLA